MLESGDPLLIELYTKMRGQLLRPKTIVSYDREAFVYTPEMCALHWTETCTPVFFSTDFLEPGRQHVRAEGSTVLEVKYDAFLAGSREDGSADSGQKDRGILKIRGMPEI